MGVSGIAETGATNTESLLITNPGIDGRNREMLQTRGVQVIVAGGWPQAPCAGRRAF